MLNSPVALFLNISAVVLRRSISMTRPKRWIPGYRPGFRRRWPESRPAASRWRARKSCSRHSRHRPERLVDLMFLEPVGVAPKLLFDAVGGAVESHLRLPRAVRSLEHHALDNRSHDVAREIIVGAAAEGDVGSDPPRKIFLGDLGDPPLRMLAQQFAGVDLMTRDPYVHYCSLSGGA